MSNKLDKGNFSVRNIISSFLLYKYVYVLILIFSIIFIYVLTENLVKYGGKLTYRITMTDNRDNLYHSSIASVLNLNFRGSNPNMFKNCNIEDVRGLHERISIINSHDDYNLNVYFKSFKNKKVLMNCFKDVDSFLKKDFKELKKLLIAQNKYALEKTLVVSDDLYRMLESADTKAPSYYESIKIFFENVNQYQKMKNTLTETETLKMEPLEEWIYIEKHLMKKSDVLGLGFFLSIAFFVVFLLIKILFEYFKELKKINR